MKLKFGLSQLRKSAPLWVQQSLAFIVLLMSAKHYLVDGLPGVSDDLKVLISDWFDYVIYAVQTILAGFMALSGSRDESKPDTDNPFK